MNLFSHFGAFALALGLMPWTHAQDLSRNNQTLELKHLLRTEFLREAGHLDNGLIEKEAMNAPNDIYQFLGSNSILDNVYDIERNSKQHNIASIDMWSSFHWPYRLGLVANRYWEDVYDWYHYHRLFESQTPMMVYQSGNQAQLDQLSPAEKYDILVGDLSFTLTRANWRAGSDLIAELGRMEGWYGICNGLTAAAMNMPRPNKAIRVLAADQKTWLTFYPSDLKALAGLLWTGDTFNYKVLGLTCREERPATNGQGRVLVPECFDVNPAAWHMALANLIGKEQRAFAFDSTYKHEIWNSPIRSYQFDYVNLGSLQTVNSIREAMIPIKAYADPFRSFRNPAATHIIGVRSTVEYLGSVPAKRMDLESTSNDNHAFKTFSYDLELDAQGNILGGEWRAEDRPDFIWVTDKDKLAKVPQDAQIKPLLESQWSGRHTAFPQDKSVLEAVRSASQANKPASSVVYKLFDWAR